MKIWKEAFKIWKEFCPHIRRELLSKEGFVGWVKDLKLVKSQEEDDFFVFLVFLEESEILCPLAFTKEDLGRVYLLENLNEDRDKNFKVPYFHPVQFFEIINWFRHNSLTSRPYHYSEEFRDYLSFRKIERKINKTKNQIIRYGNRRKERINLLNESLNKYHEEISNHPLKNFKFPKGFELIKYLNIGWTRNILSEEIITIWIKIESLLFQDHAHIYSRHPPHMKLNVEPRAYFKDNDIIKREIQEYRSWRESILERRAEFLTETEKTILKEFYDALRFQIGRGDFGSFGNSGNWNDLLDIIPPFKKDKLTGMTSFFVNLMSISRYIERFFWEILQENIALKREVNTKPYFSVETKLDFKKYMESVLLEFGLALNNPFVLYVEGDTEKNILDKYLHNIENLRFRIENIQGETNLPFFLRIGKDIQELHTYYFLDYDNHEKYKKRIKDIGTTGSFFYPDFITENFSVDEFKHALFSWLDDSNILIDKDILEKISRKLELEKERSNKIIGQVNANQEIQPINTLGFEKCVLNILKLKCSKKIVNAYPDQLELDRNGFIKPLRDFINIFKSEITDRLSLIVINSLKQDLKRNKKFSFENKLEPFYKSMVDIL